MIRRGCQCVTLSLTSRMQRLCVESWTVGLLLQGVGAAAFDKGDTQMWTQEIQCRGNESQIHLCPASITSKQLLMKMMLVWCGQVWSFLNKLMK